MSVRPTRFVDVASELLPSANNLDLRSIISENLPDFLNLLEEEKSASVTYADAWSSATEQYESHFEDELSSKDKKKINKDIIEDLPEELKAHPAYLPIAVITCTLEPGEFFTEFNKAARDMFERNDWESFPYKSLLILLVFAIENLPSRPNSEMNREVFRGLETEVSVKPGQEFVLGYFASFTVKRFLARGKKEKDEEGDEDDLSDPAPSGGAPLSEPAPKTLLKVTFNNHLRGLGVRHLSVGGDGEKEVLVAPHQGFRVVDVKRRQKKGFTVVSLEPV